MSSREQPVVTKNPRIQGQPPQDFDKQVWEVWEVWEAQGRAQDFAKQVWEVWEVWETQGRAQDFAT